MNMFLRTWLWDCGGAAGVLWFTVWWSGKAALLLGKMILLAF